MPGYVIAVTSNDLMNYKITVKTSKHSPEDYIGNLGINIVARNFDTGFIKLDENIAIGSKNEDGERKFFRKGQMDVFQFEEQDIRTISAIILSRDAKGDEVLYLDYVDVEIQKSNETQSFSSLIYSIPNQDSAPSNFKFNNKNIKQYKKYRKSMIDYFYDF
ncbi:hypothetical protein BpHYR1_026194 [Brachionus plicatilis]|uniref:Uncharacterized protein n=1 Tax=Brachionus plicatilis TaxID=10195 RepID=A0A3M7SPY3_BRAPC|nr:hypothetical protein BpHYR1_026194 [Brachionus plicatilis]